MCISPLGQSLVILQPGLFVKGSLAARSLPCALSTLASEKSWSLVAVGNTSCVCMCEFVLTNSQHVSWCHWAQRSPAYKLQMLREKKVLFHQWQVKKWFKKVLSLGLKAVTERGEKNECWWVWLITRVRCECDVYIWKRGKNRNWKQLKSSSMCKEDEMTFSDLLVVRYLCCVHFYISIIYLFFCIARVKAGHMTHRFWKQKTSCDAPGIRNDFICKSFTGGFRQGMLCSWKCT